MNKKILKCFLLSLILFGCFFFVNCCNAGNFETQYCTNYEDIRDILFKNGFSNEDFLKNYNYNSSPNLPFDLDYDFWCRAFELCNNTDTINSLKDMNDGQGLIFNNVYMSIWVTSTDYKFTIAPLPPNSSKIYRTGDGITTWELTSYPFFHRSFSFCYDNKNDSFSLYGSNKPFTYESTVFNFGGNGYYIYSTSDIYSSSTSTNILYTGRDILIKKDTTIENKNSNIQITYSYSEDRSKCHVDATILNGAFSDKLYYSYQMPSISGQGLVLGKTQFPMSRFRYYFKLFDFLSSRRL